MEKISRVLFLYLKLKKGERINKVNYCMEYECSPRAFDRDVEDIRLFLSESYSGAELVYDRRFNEYYLTVSESPALDLYDFLIIVRILLSSSVLREDELTELFQNLAIRSEKSDFCVKWVSENLKNYVSENTSATIKMYGDLETAIARQQLITIKYWQSQEDMIEITVIPCDIVLNQEKGKLYLCVLDCEDRQKDIPDYYALDKIESFALKEKMDVETVLRVKQYKKNRG